VEENHKSLLQEEGFIIIQAVVDDVFEETLGFRVSSKHGGGYGTTKEERHSLLGGMRATRSTSMRFTEPQGHVEEPPVPPRRSTRSTAPPPYTPIYSSYGFIILSEEEEKKLSRLEERLVPNVDFDDQALNYLGFGTTYITCWGTLDGCNSLTECRRTPTRSSPWKS
jgi:hypothetical protein